jgi:hypothetical protein
MNIAMIFIKINNIIKKNMVTCFGRQHLTKEFILIKKESLEYKLTKLKTKNPKTGKISTQLVYSYRNNQKPIKMKEPFQYAACFNENKQLIYYGKYNNGNCISGLFLDQSEQIGMFIRSFVSITYNKGQETYTNQWNNESTTYDSDYSYKKWILNKIKIIER